MAAPGYEHRNFFSEFSEKPSGVLEGSERFGRGHPRQAPLPQALWCLSRAQGVLEGLERRSSLSRAQGVLEGLERPSSLSPGHRAF